jgi:hypothetical protein
VADEAAISASVTNRPASRALRVTVRDRKVAARKVIYTFVFRSRHFSQA